MWPHSSLLLFPRRSSTLLRVILLMVLATLLTSVLHAGSRVSCHSFLNLRLCLSKLSRPGTSLLRSESVIFLVDSLYGEAIEAVKSRAALSASSFGLIWIPSKINSYSWLWNRSQSVNLSTGLERYLVLTCSSEWKTTGRWSETRMSETMAFDSRTFLCTTLSSKSPFPAGE
jgi:hypothetical protein